MKTSAIIIIFFLCTAVTVQAQTPITSLNLKESKEQVLLASRWNQFGFVIATRNKTETVLYFIDHNGSQKWMKHIPNEDFTLSARATTVMGSNAGKLFLITHLIKGGGTLISVNICDLDGNITMKQTTVAGYNMYHTDVTEDGILFTLNVTNKPGKLIKITNEGEVRELKNPELPGGEFQVLGVKGNDLVFKNSYTDTYSSFLQDTLYALSPEGKLSKTIVLVSKLPAGMQPYTEPEYYFDPSGNYFYSYCFTCEGPKTPISGYCLTKYDQDGNNLYSSLGNFKALNIPKDVHFSSKVEFRDGSTIWKPPVIEAFSSAAWGDVCLIMEPAYDAKKTAAILMSGEDGKVKQVIADDHLDIKHSWGPAGYLRPIQEMDVLPNNFSTFFTLHADPANTGNTSAFRKAQSLMTREKKLGGYYRVERFGINDLVIEFLDNIGIVNVYN